MPRPIRLYWCTNAEHDSPDYTEALEYVPREHRTGHYHIAPLVEALRWYGYENISKERVETWRISVDA